MSAADSKFALALRRPEPRAVQPASEARHRTSATLANSDGWSWNEPSGNHA